MQAQHVTIAINAPFGSESYQNLDKAHWEKRAVAIRDRNGGFSDVVAKGDRDKAIIRFRNIDYTHQLDYTLLSRRLGRLFMRSLPHYAAMDITKMKAITVQVSAIHDPTTSSDESTVDLGPEVCNGISQWFAQVFPKATITPELKGKIKAA